MEIVKSTAVLDLEKQIEIVATGMASHKPASKEFLDANLEIYKLQNLIKVQVANEAKEVREKELAEKRNARVLLADDMISTYIASEKASKDKSLSIEEKNAVHDLHKAARERVINELLAKHATSAPAKAAGEAGTKGEKSTAIRAMLIADLDAGKTITEAKKNAEAAGYTRGTVGTVATVIMSERAATV